MDSLKVVAVASSEQVRALLTSQLKELAFIHFQGVNIELADTVRQCQELGPDVIIVDMTDRELDAGLFIQAIGMNPENPCAIFAMHRDMDLKIFQEAVRQGAKEFIQYPEDKQALETALRKHLVMLSRMASQSFAASTPAEPKAAKGRLITVFSGKGGAGCSTIATNLAYELQKTNRKSVALIDMDQVFCNSAVMLNLKPSYSLGDLADSAAADIDESLIRKISLAHESGLQLVAGSKNILDEHELVPPDVLEAVINTLLKRHEFVIVDLPTHVLDPYHQYLVERSDLVLLVSCPDVASLYRTRQYLDLAQKYLDTKKVKLVLNRHNLKAVYGMSNEALESEFRYEIFSRLPNDWDLNVEANSLGTLLSKVNPKSDLVKSIQALASKIAGEEVGEAPQDPASKPNLLGKLFGKNNANGHNQPSDKGPVENVVRQTRQMGI